MTTRALVLTLSLLTSACMHHVDLEVLAPADITLPSDVRVLAVIDRSAPGNAGQHVLGALEGLVTGEGVGADRSGASEAVERLIAELAASPRFDVVVPIARPRDVKSDVFDTVLDWRTARRLAQQVGADALVSLEVFDSNAEVTLTSTRRTEQRDGREVSYLEHEAARTTEVHTGWRIYDPERRVLLDDRKDLTFAESHTATARSRDAALANLPSPEDTVMAIGEIAGSDYGTRIAPHFVLVKRAYFGSGDDRLKDARQLVRTGQWERAARVWEGLASDPDTKVAARALHNLGVYHELGGRLPQARASVQRALDVHDFGASYSYLRELETRLMQDRVLSQQMAGVAR